MRALTLYQPWATAIAIGSKRIETRSWRTDYRGLLAIHASKKCDCHEIDYMMCCWHMDAALSPLGGTMTPGARHWSKILTFGAIVGVVNLVGCLPTSSFTNGELNAKRYHISNRPESGVWTENQMGDFSMGRYGWRLENPRRLLTPIPCRGYQQIWHLTSDDEAKVLDQLKNGG